jgi:1-acyl-sn-glycerol-3-phosphate acyltransferase
LTEAPEARQAAPLVARLGGLIYRLTGWKCVGETPRFRKYVVITAPHTSNWDGLFLLAAVAILRLKFSFFGKHTLFRGPLGWILRAFGGIPLDRTRHQSFVKQAVAWFEENETFALGVAPEGTRKYTPGWKTGFYYIALQARVPVVLSYIDYARKEVGIRSEVLIPSGDIERDFEFLRRQYASCLGLRPEFQGPVVPLTGTRDRSEEGAPDVTE